MAVPLQLPLEKMEQVRTERSKALKTLDRMLGSYLSELPDDVADVTEVARLFGAYLDRVIEIEATACLSLWPTKSDYAAWLNALCVEELCVVLEPQRLQLTDRLHFGNLEQLPKYRDHLIAVARACSARWQQEFSAREERQSERQTSGDMCPAGSGGLQAPDPYSDRDARVYRIVGRDAFENLTNEEIRARYRKALRDASLPNAGDSLRACLNRIRRYHRLPASVDLRKKNGQAPVND